MNHYLGSCIEIIVVIFIYANLICASKESNNLLVLFLYPLLIIFENNGWNIWNKLLNNKVVKMLGKISIDMYLNHSAFICFYMSIHNKGTFFMDALLYLLFLIVYATVIGGFKNLFLKCANKASCIGKHDCR